MAKTLISTHTASASATLNITSGIDSTYPVYEIHFVSWHPGNDSTYPRFQASINGGTDYGVAITTSYIRADHQESDGGAGLAYIAGYDAYQSTSGIHFAEDVGADADQTTSGIMMLFDPSSTTYVKHFTFETNANNGGNQSAHQLIAGYVNTTSAVNALSFFCSSGNIDAGVIKMFGVS